MTGLTKQAYTVQEIQAPVGYVLSAEPLKISPDDFGRGNNLEIAREVVNKKEKTSISGQKTWNDNDNQDGKRPSKITVNLLANGVKVASKEVKADKDGNWLYQFDNLDLVDDAGHAIAYSVSEEPVKGYVANVEGTNITNSRTPEVTEVTVKKVWDDKENKDGLRPDKVTVRLLADGQEVASQELSAATDWKTSFTNLPVYKAGKKIDYTLTEDSLAGYTTKIDGFTVTNHHTPTTPPTTPSTTPPTTPSSTSEKPQSSTTPKAGKKKILPSTGEVVAYGLIGVGLLLAIVAVGLLLRGKRKDK